MSEEIEGILRKLPPELPPQHYEPPSKGRYKRREPLLSTPDMPEYQKRLELPTTRLSRSDLQTLCQVIRSGMSDLERCAFKVVIASANYEEKSLDALLSHASLPNVIHNFALTIFDRVTDDFGATDDLSRKSIFLKLRPWGSDCVVHAYDEIWCEGKSQQIINFFRTHGPWYGRFFIRTLHVAIPTIYVISWWVAYYLISKNHYWVLGFYLFAIACIIRVNVLLWQERLLSHTIIVLRETECRLNNELLMPIFTVLIFVVSLALLLVELLK